MKGPVRDIASGQVSETTSFPVRPSRPRMFVLGSDITTKAFQPASQMLAEDLYAAWVDGK
jgi:hypothetical protein